MAFIPDDANKRIRKELSPNAGDMYRALCENRHHEYRVAFITQADGRSLEDLLEEDWEFPSGSQRNALTELAKKNWIHRHATYIELLVGDFSPVDAKHPQKEILPFMNGQKRAGRKTVEKKAEEKEKSHFHEIGKIEKKEELDFHDFVKCFHCFVFIFHEIVKTFPESVINFHETMINFHDSVKIPNNNDSRALIPSQTIAENSQKAASGSGCGAARARDTPPEKAAIAAAAAAAADKNSSSEKSASEKPKRQWLELEPKERVMSIATFTEHLQELYPRKNVKQIAAKLRQYCRENPKVDFSKERLKGWVDGETEEITDEAFLTAIDGEIEKGEAKENGNRSSEKRVDLSRFNSPQYE